jgi:hypothetical protein
MFFSTDNSDFPPADCARLNDALGIILARYGYRYSEGYDDTARGAEVRDLTQRACDALTDAWMPDFGLTDAAADSLRAYCREHLRDTLNLDAIVEEVTRALESGETQYEFSGLLTRSGNPLVWTPGVGDCVNTANTAEALAARVSL